MMLRNDNIAYIAV